MVGLMNPLSRELKVMRQSLLFGGLESVVHNLNRKKADIKFFEFGNTYRQYPDKHQEKEITVRFSETARLALFVSGAREAEHWYNTDKKVDIHYLKGIVMNIFGRLGIRHRELDFFQENHPALQSYASWKIRQEVLAGIGVVRKELLASFGIKQEVLYADINWELLCDRARASKVDFRELPRFPEVRRDLALLLSNEIRFEEIEKLAYLTERKLLKKISLFDIYEGERIGQNKKSYAVTFILRHDEKTLTDQEIDQVMKNLVKAFEEKLGAIIR
jgi:phenylalanyl-tRNA synthetase beta chain